MDFVKTQLGLDSSGMGSRLCLLPGLCCTRGEGKGYLCAHGHNYLSFLTRGPPAGGKFGRPPGSPAVLGLELSMPHTNSIPSTLFLLEIEP